MKARSRGDESFDAHLDVLRNGCGSKAAPAHGALARGHGHPWSPMVASRPVPGHFLMNWVDLVANFSLIFVEKNLKGRGWGIKIGFVLLIFGVDEGEHFGKLHEK